MRTKAPSDGRVPAVGRRSPRSYWLLAFSAYFLLIAGWVFAAPHAGAPDEGDHTLRAYAAADGQIFPELVTTKSGTGGRFTAPQSLVPDYCWIFKPYTSAACAAEPGGDRTQVEVDVIIGRYPPLYYAVVGIPLRISPDWWGILLARLISAALCAAMLANALTDALRWSRHRLLAVGVLTAVTPMAVHMAAAVNPNGLEIATGVALAAAAVPLLQLPEAARSRQLLRHVGLAAVTMSAIRVLGPLWVTIVIAMLLLPLNRAKLVGLWRWPAVRRWIAVVAAVMAASATWTFTFKANDVGDYTGGWTIERVQAVRLALEHSQNWADQMVGVMSWLDTRMPPFVYVAWQAAVAALLVWGFVLSDRRGRLVLVALGIGTLGVPFAMQLAYINTTGLITAGRYLLPAAVALPILAAVLIQRSGLTAAASRSLVRILVVVLLPLHLVCLVFTMVRWQRGFTPDFVGGLRVLNPLAGPWHPPLGSVAPLVVTLAGLVLLGWTILSWNPVAADTETASDGTGVESERAQAEPDQAGAAQAESVTAQPASQPPKDAVSSA